MDLHAALARVGVRVPDILLPRPGIDLNAWAVVACDQFTSQPEYWQQVRGIVGDQPSTLSLIFPEVYLDQPDPEGAINATMRQYLDEGLFEPKPWSWCAATTASAMGPGMAAADDRGARPGAVLRGRRTPER